MTSSIAFYYFVAVFFAVHSAPVEPDLPVSIPFYGVLHRNNTANGKLSNSLRKEILRINGIAEHYIDLQKDNKTSNLLMTLDPEIKMESVTLTPVGDRKITVESTLKPSFFDSLRLIRSNYSVSLGFVTPPALHSADIIVLSGNQLVPYYLKQININLNKEGNNQILQVDSVFIRRDLNASEAGDRKKGLIMVKSIWNYTLESSSQGYFSIKLHYFSSEAFFSVGMEPSTTTTTSTAEPSTFVSNSSGVSFVTYLSSVIFICFFVIIAYL